MQHTVRKTMKKGKYNYGTLESDHAKQENQGDTRKSWNIN